MTLPSIEKRITETIERAARIADAAKRAETALIGPSNEQGNSGGTDHGRSGMVAKINHGLDRLDAILARTEQTVASIGKSVGAAEQRNPSVGLLLTGHIEKMGERLVPRLSERDRNELNETIADGLSDFDVGIQPNRSLGLGTGDADSSSSDGGSSD